MKLPERLFDRAGTRRGLRTIECGDAEAEHVDKLPGEPLGWSERFLRSDACSGSRKPDGLPSLLKRPVSDAAQPWRASHSAGVVKLSSTTWETRPATTPLAMLYVRGMVLMVRKAGKL